MVNKNILSERYVTAEMNEIFSKRGKIIAERELWISVIKAQKEAGMSISNDVIERYEAAKDKIDLEYIAEREAVLKHDVKARIEAFNAAAGAGEYVHVGMTARDLTDNVEQMQILNASKLVFGKSVSILRHILDKAQEYAGIELALTGRTHHQPAQTTLLGRRFSMWAEELLHHLIGFERMIEAYPLRGIKGPVGTQADMLALLGSPEKVDQLEETIAKDLGFSKMLNSPGQIYPRSLDYEMLSKLAQVGAACTNFAIGMRLMAGYELVTEGFAEGQVGSTAMPHKMNTRSSERMWGFGELLKMYGNGASRLSGAQWEEGDVSDSVVRRVLIPNAPYAMDGLCETTLTVLNEMGAYPNVISKEVDKYFPFLATTKILTLALNKGVGREQAHEVIKKHAVSAAKRMREEGTDTNYFVKSLCVDPVFVDNNITSDNIETILSDKASFIGNANRQIGIVIANAEPLLSRYAAEASYEPRAIL